MHRKGKDKLLDEEEEEEDDEDVEPETEVQDKRRFAVVRWRAVATWTWGGGVDSCSICRNHITDICIECQAVSRSATPSQKQMSECSVVWGMCNHSFHQHCIRRWLRMRNTCPLDNTEWMYQRFHDTQAFGPPDPFDDEVEPTE